MNLEISRDAAENLLTVIDKDSLVYELLKNGFEYGADETRIDSSLLSVKDLDSLYDFAKEHGLRGIMMTVTSLRNIRSDVKNAKIGKLNALADGLIIYFKTDAIDGWVYRNDKSGIPIPYLIRNIRFHEPDKHRETPAMVSIHLSANGKSAEGSRNEGKGIEKTSVYFTADDIVKKTIPELLIEKNIFHETPELREVYETHVKAFKLFQPMHNKQFWCKGYASRADSYSFGSFNGSDKPFRCVNDEEINKRTFTGGADASFWREHGVDSGFDQMPFHCYLYMYHLDAHEQVWVHVDILEEYVYDATIRDKIVLPEEHRDLIETLVEDKDILVDDIVNGKSGGTTIICFGPPGVGKTLTAEVYSEIAELVLFRVHSGLLGTSAKEVEDNLEKILMRAQRWGALLLIDEADVYIHARGTNLDQNAVVASFLRKLEYFSGLLILTTNRKDNVDDAILSRCIAQIKYEVPNDADRKKIWTILSTQFGIDLNGKLIDELCRAFPTASGRDIKELLKLTEKFVRRNKIVFNVEAFRKMAQFRGL